MTSLPRIAEIKQAVAREYGVSVATMSEPVPTSECGLNAYPVSRPRQVAMTLACFMTEHSEIRIGHFFGGRHPSTVRHARAAVAERRRHDPKLHETMRRMSLELVRG